MHAYNAEKTIGRAIGSILNQTAQDFTFYCLDNGSTDDTGRIIQYYAARDSRIIPLFEKENIQPGVVKAYLPMVLSEGDDGYYARLDADDEYRPDFLEKMLAFVTQNNLDIAICGTEYMYTDGNSRLDTPSESLILEGTGFAKHLPKYFKYVTRIWGGLYSLKLLEKMEFPSQLQDKSASFYDVMCALRGLRNAHKAGILAESLHKYHSSPNQLSVVYSPNWFFWINEMQRQTREFLLSYEPVSEANECFLNIRFLVWMKYVLPRLQSSDAILKTKINDHISIFQDERTKKWLQLDWKKIGITTNKNDFIQENLAWISEQQLECGEVREAANNLISLLKNLLAE